MKELQKKHKTRRLIYSIPSLILLTFFTLMFVRGAIKMVAKERESNASLKNTKDRVVALTLREQELRKDITRLGTEEGIENEIRDRFSVIEEGEHLAVIVDDKKNATSTDTNKKPWYKKLWAAIIGDK